MLIYVNFYKKIYIKELLNFYIYKYNLYIYIKELLKNKYIVRKSYKHIGSKRPFTGNQDVENSFCKVYMGSF